MSEMFWTVIWLDQKWLKFMKTWLFFFKMLEISGLFFYMELFEKLRFFWKLFFMYENRFKVMKTSEYFWNVLKCVLIRVEVVKIYENVTEIFRKFSKCSDCSRSFRVFYGFLWCFYGFLCCVYGFLWFSTQILGHPF